MRIIYSFFLYLIWPLLPIYLLKRTRKNPDYKLFWRERFAIGLQNNLTNKQIIWIHAVSVGEVKGLIKLIELIEQNYPEHQILLTQFTPTGRAIAKQLFPNVMVHYLPYDVPHAIRKFYQNFKPTVGLIMETEIWPNLLFYGRRYNVPLLLINARLSIKSYNSYNKFKFFITPIINNLSMILCQDQTSYTNFKQLGYQREITIVGSTKFDIDPNTAVDSKLLNSLTKHIKYKPIIVFFSTRSGEEELILANLNIQAEYLVVIVPRHPERFSLVEDLLIKYNISYQKRSDGNSIDTATKVLLGDSIGEMASYLAMAKLAIMGGSFTNNGGQNLLEAIALGKPVIFAKSIYNFETICLNAIATSCAIQVNDIVQCYHQVDMLLANQARYQDMLNKCATFMHKYSGASLNILQNIKRYITI